MKGKDMMIYAEKKRAEEIIGILSDAHVQHSTDPETLFYGGYQDYEYDSKGGWQKINDLKNELLMLCRKAEEGWAM